MEAMYDMNENPTSDNEDAKFEIVADDHSEEEIPEPVTEVTEAEESVETDYEALIASDIQALKAEFPELRSINDITDLNNPLRYAALRDLGLSPEEAYMATSKRRTQDTRSHLKSAHGRNAATVAGMMSQHELTTARELFPGMSDSDLQRLYKKVTK